MDYRLLAENYMPRRTVTIGSLLDRLDIGGWLLLITGGAIIGFTLLAPAWRDLKVLEHRRDGIAYQAALLGTNIQNYNQFLEDLENEDPVLMERLAWYQLHMQPKGTQALDEMTPMDDSRKGNPIEWLKPAIDPTFHHASQPNLPDTRLMRLALGPARPWVMALGAWLLFFALLTKIANSKPKLTSEDID